MTEQDIRHKILIEVDRSNASAVARKIGCSASYLSDYLHGKRDAGALIQRYLGVERVISYRKKRKTK